MDVEFEWWHETPNRVIECLITTMSEEWSRYRALGVPELDRLVDD